jgi:hypothetical protein
MWLEPRSQSSRNASRKAARNIASILARLEPTLYALWAAAATLGVALLFYSSLRQQTRLTEIVPTDFPARLARVGEWSAPLDDVFIHFDFARSTARGHPFEWSEGNGYSSGGTSLLYPFVLAIGYAAWAGFRQQGLMVWAALIACVSSFAFLLAARRLFRDLPRIASWLAPPLVLGAGVLSWSLFSGMEVALFLALWGGALIAWDDLRRGPPGLAAPRRTLHPALILGLWGALVVATRPEGATTVALFGLSAAWTVSRRSRVSRGLAVLALSGAPAALVLVGHAVANRHFTGETTAAGALVKLELHHPYLKPEEVWQLYKFHVDYQLRRVTEYHLATPGHFGWIAWYLAGFALLPKATRGAAVLLWLSAASWVLTVGTNGQVRWQNERYTMPALAWLLLAASLGAGGLATLTIGLGRRALATRVLGLGVAGAALGLFAWHQAPRFREQVWFFGRAARNIRDQHVQTGRLIRHVLQPPIKRVLVGDAGAIPYAADVPALDVIGLGGFRGLPFARASRLGVGAALELIERLPDADRPDLLALYPSWWGDFPRWFGERVGEVPVAGNVICGGASKVLYRPRWDRFEGSGAPTDLAAGQRVVDALDVADLVDERAHGMQLSAPRAGVVGMKLLEHPRERSRELWDAGRVLNADVTLSARLGAEPGRSARLRFRLAPHRNAKLRVKLAGALLGELQVEGGERWVEPELSVPAERSAGLGSLEIEAPEGDPVLYHVWLLAEAR